MLADHDITRDELFAVGATFTLVAWGFAYLYVVCQAVAPQSFTAAVDPQTPRTWVELLFLSFTTLSSTGLSDVVPIRPFARSLVMFEQLAGIAYVAMVVSRLVGLTVMRGTHVPDRRGALHTGERLAVDAERVVAGGQVAAARSRPQRRLVGAAHVGARSGQRGWKRQPGGGSIGLGTSPLQDDPLAPRRAGRGRAPGRPTAAPRV